jgi:hypothetical protein
MKKRIFSLGLLILVISLSACRPAFLAADQLPWVGDEAVLFRDDFSGENVGWSTHQDSLSFAGFDLSGYRLQASMPDFQFWSVPGLNFQDTLIQVRTQKLAGPNDNLFGLICRYQDDDNFYALVIGSDGYYGIYKRIAGVQTLVDQVNLDFSAAIAQGDSANTIQAVCQADQLALIVNDTPLIQVTDASLTHGDVGLIVGNFAEPGVDILFDDFIVVAP